MFIFLVVVSVATVNAGWQNGQHQGNRPTQPDAEGNYYWWQKMKPFAQPGVLQSASGHQQYTSCHAGQDCVPRARCVNGLYAPSGTPQIDLRSKVSSFYRPAKYSLLWRLLPCQELKLVATCQLFSRSFISSLFYRIFSLLLSRKLFELLSQPKSNCGPSTEYVCCSSSAGNNQILHQTKGILIFSSRSSSFSQQLIKLILLPITD